VKVGCAVALGIVLVGATSAPVPRVMIGTWARGSCARPADRLVISPQSAKVGTAAAAPIVYYPDDDGRGHGAIHWREEGNVDNFVYVRSRDVIVHNTQGYHMPGRVVYKRCTPSR
jgi:hypothetical protein